MELLFPPNETWAPNNRWGQLWNVKFDDVLLEKLAGVVGKRAGYEPGIEGKIKREEPVYDEWVISLYDMGEK